MVAYAFNPSTGEAEHADLCELEFRLVFITSSRLARAIYNTFQTKQNSLEPLNSLIPLKHSVEFYQCLPLVE